VTAGVQTLIAFIGYLIAGVPRLALAVTLTFVIAFIPFIGAGTIVVAVAALLALSGRIGAAIFLALWGLVFVGLSDNVLKPYLIKTDVEIHGAVIFFALLGGLAVFGPIGLLVGPLIVAFFLATVRLASGEEAPGQVAPEPPAS
jgi:predicted PurR-regulated permease PerM